MCGMTVFEPPENAKSHDVLMGGLLQHTAEACGCIRSRLIPIAIGWSTNVKPFHTANKISSRTNHCKQKFNDGREKYPVFVTDKLFLLDDHRSKSVYQVQSSVKLETAEAVVILRYMGSFYHDSIDANYNFFRHLSPTYDKKTSWLLSDKFDFSIQDSCFGLKPCKEGTYDG